MGARGPQPKPTALKQAEGTFRRDRAPANEPVARGKPACPKTLGPDARAEYRRLIKTLGEMSLVGRIDAYALERYVRTWVRWRKVVAVLEKAGELQVFKDEKGAPKAIQPNALVSIERGLSERLEKLEQSFGMNPSSRSRINVAAAPGADALAAFLAEQNGDRGEGQ